jgi:hypothetical protein
MQPPIMISYSDENVSFGQSPGLNQAVSYRLLSEIRIGLTLLLSEDATTILKGCESSSLPCTRSIRVGEALVLKATPVDSARPYALWHGPR